MALETFQLRGRNYDEVVRQLVQTYNSSEGWAVVRVVNRLTSLDVILERNSEQGVSTDTSKGAVVEQPKGMGGKPTTPYTLEELKNNYTENEQIEVEKPKPSNKTSTRKVKVETPKTDENKG